MFNKRRGDGLPHEAKAHERMKVSSYVSKLYQLIPCNLGALADWGSKDLSTTLWCLKYFTMSAARVAEGRIYLPSED